MVKNLKNKKKKKGFTLIELIIVIAIIAILAAIAIPKFGDIRKDAAYKSDIANAKTIANAATTLLADQTLTELIYVDEEITSGNKIEEYLQNPPKPKTKGYAQFVVEISGDTVTVSMTKTAGSNTSTYKLFPIATGTL
ncbi:prepilin-type N-terminal cleavage/methylation domain-containing protein [Clostridium sp. HCS.1]|uniref:prepilin-type N-terminal cleavage/methylation domain-containing protein n=1 Tax=Clostridium sp. HCS.1 TaxID=3238594 RepID=UPI003A0FE675